MRQGLPGQGAWGQLGEVLTQGSFLCEVVPQLLGVPPALGLVCVLAPEPSWRGLGP